ncbi:hypothetical protein [Spirosoma sp.]|uniref:hypothetical protein n=1 Tax=Spirosoma sp. TaxID=1899569 RepID=UPI002631EC82|nr:hypothetical protein [Spirosoma sp.]MCX6217671.1 hypothetical protein [Spirosoma sp.]
MANSKGEINDYLVTEAETGKKWLYGSMRALLAHKQNPINLTEQRISQIRRETGWPVTVQGCTIDKLRKWSVSEVMLDNQNQV